MPSTNIIAFTTRQIPAKMSDYDDEDFSIIDREFDSYDPKELLCCKVNSNDNEELN